MPEVAIRVEKFGIAYIDAVEHHAKDLGADGISREQASITTSREVLVLLTTMSAPSTIVESGMTSLTSIAGAESMMMKS